MTRVMLYVGIAIVSVSVSAGAGPIPATPGAASAPGLDTAQIMELTGAKGVYDANEGVFRVSVPRSDLQVVIDGRTLKPAMGLTSWAAFCRVGTKVLVMGDMVLTQEQVRPVLRAALDHGLSVTALHNHFLEETPRIMYMHIEGTGVEDSLARSVGAVFAEIDQSARRPRDVDGVQVFPGDTTLNVSELSRTLKLQGELKDGVFKIVVGRTASVAGHPMGGAMGVNTWAAFEGIDKHAIVDGDFAVLESELQPVIRELVRSGIQITAIHQHMIGESPRILFLHFWGVGPAGLLASAVRAALDQTSP